MWILIKVANVNIDSLIAGLFSELFDSEWLDMVMHFSSSCPGVATSGDRDGTPATVKKEEEKPKEANEDHIW